MRRGEGTIRLHAVATLSRQSAGAHHLLFKNSHASACSVYLANALVPQTNQVGVTGQQRDGDQRQLIIDFVVRPKATSTAAWLLSGFAFATMGLWRRLGRRNRLSRGSQAA